MGASIYDADLRWTLHLRAVGGPKCEWQKASDTALIFVCKTRLKMTEPAKELNIGDVRIESLTDRQLESSLSASSLDRLARLVRSKKGMRSTSLASRFEPYQHDSVEFAEDVSSAFSFVKQREIARSVVANRRTAVQPCHNTGKTALAAHMRIWLSVRLPVEVFLVLRRDGSAERQNDTSRPSCPSLTRGRSRRAPIVRVKLLLQALARRRLSLLRRGAQLLLAPANEVMNPNNILEGALARRPERARARTSAR